MAVIGGHCPPLNCCTHGFPRGVPTERTEMRACVPFPLPGVTAIDLSTCLSTRVSFRSACDRGAQGRASHCVRGHRSAAAPGSAWGETGGKAFIRVQCGNGARRTGDGVCEPRCWVLLSHGINCLGLKRLLMQTGKAGYRFRPFGTSQLAPSRAAAWGWMLGSGVASQGSIGHLQVAVRRAGLLGWLSSDV